MAARGGHAPGASRRRQPPSRLSEAPRLTNFRDALALVALDTPSAAHPSRKLDRASSTRQRRRCN
ncbi:hypothetical protein ACFPRL_25795 [Pseudoclavibacter helvolus]